MNGQVPGGLGIFVHVTWHRPRQVLCAVKHNILRKMVVIYFTKFLHCFFNYFEHTQHRFCTVLTRT
jgi:hypothetical protein